LKSVQEPKTLLGKRQRESFRRVDKRGTGRNDTSLL
jgi:hypothetical protein